MLLAKVNTRSKNIKSLKSGNVGSVTFVTTLKVLFL